MMKAFAVSASIAIFFLIYWVLPNGKVPARAVLPTAVDYGTDVRSSEVCLYPGPAAAEFSGGLRPVCAVGELDVLGLPDRTPDADRSALVGPGLQPASGVDLNGRARAGGSWNPQGTDGRLGSSVTRQCDVWHIPPHPSALALRYSPSPLVSTQNEAMPCRFPFVYSLDLAWPWCQLSSLAWRWRGVRKV